MGLFSRLKTGITITKQSAFVMREHPRLALFPIVSGLASVVFLAALVVPLSGVLVLDTGGQTAVGLVALVGLYFGTAFITAFFSAGLVDQTRAVLDGRDPSLRAGIGSAWAVKRPLFAWALISATVGVVLDAINDSTDSPLGQILAAVVGIAWTVVTFFVIPVIVFERPSIREMFTRSGETFKNTYGETPISLAGTSIIALLAGAPLLLPGAYLLFGLNAVLVGVPLLVAGIAVSQLVAYTLRGIVKTALYWYATEGHRPDEFDEIFDQLEDLRKPDSESSGAGTPGIGGVR